MIMMKMTMILMMIHIEKSIATLWFVYNTVFSIWYCIQKYLPEMTMIKHMMTSSNGDIFCATGPLWGESTVDR